MNLVNLTLLLLASYPSIALLYLMVAAQGALGYGVTSVFGAIVAEIFQGKHYGTIFGTVMLAAICGGLTALSYRQLPEGAGSKASGYEPGRS